VPFYSDRLPPDLLDTSGAVDAERWHEVPVLTRAQVRAAGAALASSAPPREHGPVALKSTSGSTGEPVSVGVTALAGLFWQAFSLRDHLWHRRDLAGKSAVIRYLGDGAPAEGLQQKGWGPSTDLAFDTGPTVVFSVQTDVAAQAEWLAREDPDYLLTYPSNALALAEHFAARELRLPRLREVRCVSELLTREVREACRRVWGVPATDIYSAEEVGYLALQCPEHEHGHVQAEGILVELLDEDGLPCAPGQVGRVVVTPLHNFATVLLRYELGDYAEAGGPCPCGRGLPVLARIVGRERNLVVLPSGRNYSPWLAEIARHRGVPVGLQQIVQRSLELMEFRYTAERDLTAAEEQDLANLLNASVGHSFQVRFVRLPDIPRSAAGKREEFICAVQSDRP
jgi:phenylacetate-CoA ligase